MGKKLIIGIVVFIVVLVSFTYSLIHFNVIWTLAPKYDVKEQVKLDEPIMDMEEYKKIWNTHRRPYIYHVNAANAGEVYIVGVSHTKDPNNTDLDSIEYYWDKFEPDVVLVEGIVGNLITWFQDPVIELGEGGLVTALAHRDNVDLYSWEPKRESEIEFLLREYSAEEIAMFYSFRPYFSNMRYGVYENPEATLQEYLDNKTDYPHITGVFKTWQELDKKWNTDFPNIEWRDYGAGKGYPEGYLNEIWNQTNLLRDIHMIQIIHEFVSEGKKVFVTMGVSHAPRIEKSLRSVIR